MLRLWDAGEVSDEVLAGQVSTLVSNRDGARGFFVIALAGESALMDRLPDSLIRALRGAGEQVVDLTARNLAMSTAMALNHARDGHEGQEQGSLRVQDRCMELLRQLDSAGVESRLSGLLAAARDGDGEDVAFLDRWGYDPEQRQAIAGAILQVAQ